MPYEYDVETSQGPVTITLDRQVDPKILAKSQMVHDAVAKELQSRLSSTTTTPTTTEGVPGQGVQIPRSADAPLEAAGATLGAAAALPATASPLGPAAPVIGAGLGGGMTNRALDFMRGSPRAAAASAREKLGRGGDSPLETVAKETGSAVGRGATGQMLGDVAVPIAAGVARATGLTKVLPAGALAAKRSAEALGIPLTTADIKGSRTMAGIERMPSYFTFGSGIMQRYREGQLSKAGSAVDQLVDSISQNGADEITAGRHSLGGIGAVARGFRGDAEQVFRAFDAKIGPEPVVPTTELRRAVGSALDRGAQTPIGPATGAQRFRGGSEVVTPTGEVSSLAAERTAAARAASPPPKAPGAALPALESRSLESAGARTGALEPVPSGGTAQGEYVGQQPVDLDALIHEATQQEFIPWRLARDIESQLGQQTFGGGRKAIGSIQQGQTGALYDAVRQDIDTFLTTPGAAGTAQELEELKQFYASGKYLFNESVVKNMAKPRVGDNMNEEQVIPAAFRPGQATDTLDYKIAVPERTWTEAVAAWMDGRRKAATSFLGGREVFSPGRFVADMQKYEKNGQLQIILGPEQYQAFRQHMDVLSRLGTAERLAGNPSGTGQAVMSIEQLAPLLRLGVSAGTIGPAAALGGLPGAVGSFALPMGVAKLVTNPHVIDYLTEGLPGLGFSGRIARPLIRTGAQLGVQEFPPLPR